VVGGTVWQAIVCRLVTLKRAPKIPAKYWNRRLDLEVLKTWVMIFRKMTVHFQITVFLKLEYLHLKLLLNDQLQKVNLRVH